MPIPQEPRGSQAKAVLASGGRDQSELVISVFFCLLLWLLCWCLLVPFCVLCFFSSLCLAIDERCRPCRGWRCPARPPSQAPSSCLLPRRRQPHVHAVLFISRRPTMIPPAITVHRLPQQQQHSEMTMPPRRTHPEVMAPPEVQHTHPPRSPHHQHVHRCHPQAQHARHQPHPPWPGDDAGRHLSSEWTCLRMSPTQHVGGVLGPHHHGGDAVTRPPPPPPPCIPVQDHYNHRCASHTHDLQPISTPPAHPPPPPRGCHHHNDDAARRRPPDVSGMLPHPDAGGTWATRYTISQLLSGAHPA